MESQEYHEILCVHVCLCLSFSRLDSAWKSKGWIQIAVFSSETLCLEGWLCYPGCSAVDYLDSTPWAEIDCSDLSVCSTFYHFYKANLHNIGKILCFLLRWDATATSTTWRSDISLFSYCCGIGEKEKEGVIWIPAHTHWQAGESHSGKVKSSTSLLL